MATLSLHGVVQHSFGLQLPERPRPFGSRDVLSGVSENFNCEPFSVRPVGRPLVLEGAPHAAHSPLAQRDLTTLQALQQRYIGPESSVRRLPQALWWAYGHGAGSTTYEEPSLIFADEYDRGSASLNDFLVSDQSDPKESEAISQVLLEIMAHKRSRLFGFRLANRFVNVLLPYTLLLPSEADQRNAAWFMQPLVSFIRGGRYRGRLRLTYSLTFFLVPIVNGEPFGCREITPAEVDSVVNAGWGFAASPPEEALGRFDIGGPLFEYLDSATRLNLLEGENGSLPLRRIIELSAFGVGVILAQSRTGRVGPRAARLIGNDVLMALGSTRVSSVVVRADSLEAEEVRSPAGKHTLPQPLTDLLETLAKPLRAPLATDPAARRYRLDRPFVDDDLYATGVVPIRRCLVVVSGAAQDGVRESTLMQAGSVAYMTIGAAMAIGTMRAIDRRLEYLEGSGPNEIAEIDREIAADLSEIYDLDITRESYRETYRRLRDSLGITRDYKVLQNKMKALYRATSTLHEDKAERLLAWLTAAIVVLSVLILIGTVIVAAHDI